MFTIIVYGCCFGASVLWGLRTMISYQSTTIISTMASFAQLRQMEGRESRRYFFLLSRVLVILLIIINSSPKKIEEKNSSKVQQKSISQAKF
jgi:hypothetical protein